DVDRAQRAAPVGPDPFQRRPRGSRAAETPHQRAGVGLVPSGAEDEGDLALLAIGQLDRHLHGQAGVEPGADAARQLRALDEGRARGVAVAADELQAIAADRALPLAAVE